jgi:hypothetical protein
MMFYCKTVSGIQSPNFKFLKNNDPDNREENNRKDKFPPLRFLFEGWIHKCRLVVVRHLSRIDAGTGSASNNPIHSDQVSQ